MTTFLQESMMTRADHYEMVVCNQSGTIAIYNPSKNIMISPSADGPLRYTKAIESGDDMVRQITQYGRSFSVVQVPYSLKLLMQELLTINIRLSLITEDNVSQIESMKNSKNIDLLLNEPDATPQMIIDQIKSALSKEEVVQSPFETITPTLTPKEIKIHSHHSDDTIVSPQYLTEAAPPLPQYNINNDESEDSFHDSPQFNVHEDFKAIYANQENNGNDDDNNDDMSNESPHMLGGSVHLRGDASNKRWTIMEKQPGTYNTKYVIQGATPEEVQIVEDSDIYVPDPNLIYFNNSIDNNLPQDDLIETVPMIRPQQMIDPYAQGGMQPSGINFSPVIRIVQGNDHSVNSQPEETTIQNSNDTDDIISTVPQGNNASSTITLPVPVPVQPTTQQPSSSTGMIDFQNIVVKKAE